VLLVPGLADSGSSARRIGPAFKVVRLLRVVLVMSRLQRSRERYRRMKMVGLAAPVEKVFEIITELREKVPRPNRRPNRRPLRAPRTPQASRRVRVRVRVRVTVAGPPPADRWERRYARRRKGGLMY
jgi:hypothetical protein